MYSTNPVRLSDTPGYSNRGGPSMGEHTMEVLTEVAGMSESEVADLVESGAAFTMVAPDVVLERPYEQWLHVLLPGVEDARDLP